MSDDQKSRPVPPAQIDLNDLLKRGQLDVSIKPAENENDARARRLRETVTFVIAVTMIAVVFLFAYAS